jgi:hypothetical protein
LGKCQLLENAEWRCAPADGSLKEISVHPNLDFGFFRERSDALDHLGRLIAIVNNPSTERRASFGSARGFPL